MPRSGTSLVEQVIASHPDVRGGGEFTLLNRLVGSLGDGQGPFRFGNLLDRVSDAQLTALGTDYVAQIRALSADARFITDKTPGNFLADRHDPPDAAEGEDHPLPARPRRHQPVDLHNLFWG